jgi:N6-adenosine-specific RNA methylase IME4
MVKFGTIVADPPWSYRSGHVTSRTSHDTPAAEHHYPTMRNQEILDLPVSSLAADDAHLYLWVTNPKMFGERGGRRTQQPAPIDILEAWGFRYITTLTWLKEGNLGMGFYFRGETEHVLFGIKGKAPIPVEMRERNWFAAPKKRHSQKPEVFYDIVERVSPGPHLELFARRNRMGWSAWGNEAISDVVVA